MRDNREINNGPRRSSVSTIFATCCLNDYNNFASPDLTPIGKRFNVEKQELKKQSLTIV